MKSSSPSQVLTLLALAAACFVAEAQSRNRITVRTYRTNYRVDTWDDGREDLYRVTFWKFGLQSVYTFDAAGHVKTLTARDTLYTFDLTGASRMLMDSGDDALEDAPEVEASAEIGCPTCEITWDTLCAVGLPEVCALDATNPITFDGDAEDSVRRFCSSFGKSCQTSAAETCEGQCTAPTNPSPTPAPTVVPAGPCNPSPCLNGGSCAVDPAGGHVCSCASGFGGMSCQTSTASLAPFFIEFLFVGTWSAARRAVLQSAAARWSEVITHAPCGGTAALPAGRLQITATLEAIDGVGGTTGSAGVSSVWGGCLAVSAEGTMRFDTADVPVMEADGSFPGVIMHEMGHVIGVGTIWGNNFGGCTTCRQTGNPAWTCPAAVSTYADIGGIGADIVEADGSSGSNCNNLDELIFGDELMSAVIENTNALSKITAAVLEDLEYIVDASAVDAYILPSKRAGAVDDPPVLLRLTDVAVETSIQVLDEEGGVLQSIDGISMAF